MAMTAMIGIFVSAGEAWCSAALLPEPTIYGHGTVLSNFASYPEEKIASFSCLSSLSPKTTEHSSTPAPPPPPPQTSVGVS
ncbi:hypothetical protein TYRP_013047 [Tyrophagus putrescentiae]|nr:hypothetical protein TYRP_013047 [Tyrophagus putrescentiae]